MAKEKRRISGITVRGFKSISTEQHVEIRPLTILAGANSSGKSSIMKPLLLLKQTLESPGDPGALLLDGPHARFTSADQLLSQLLGRARSQTFDIRLDLLGNESLKLAFRREEGKGFEVERMVYSSGSEQTEVVPRMDHSDILKILPAPWNTFHQEVEKREGKPPRWTVYRERCFLSFGLASDGGSTRIAFGPHGISPSAVIVPYIQGVLHLPGLRG